MIYCSSASLSHSLPLSIALSSHLFVLWWSRGVSYTALWNLINQRALALSVTYPQEEVAVAARGVAWWNQWLAGASQVGASFHRPSEYQSSSSVWMTCIIQIESCYRSTAWLVWCVAAWWTQEVWQRWSSGLWLTRSDVQEEEEREKTLEIRPGGGQLKSLSHARRPSPALSH